MTTAAEYIREASTAATGSTAGECIKHLDKVRIYLMAGNADATPNADASCNSSQVAQAVPAGDAIVLTTSGAGAG